MSVSLGGYQPGPPHPSHDPTCPYQQSGIGADCQCGAAEAAWRASGPRVTATEWRPSPEEASAIAGAIAASPDPLPMGWSRREVLRHDLAAAVEVWDAQSGHMPGKLASNPAVAEHLERAQDMADAARAYLADVRDHPGEDA